jgi:hypothetical protein
MRQALVALALREVIALDDARVHLCTSGVKRCKDSFGMPRYGVYSYILHTNFVLSSWAVHQGCL